MPKRSVYDKTVDLLMQEPSEVLRAILERPFWPRQQGCINAHWLSLNKVRTMALPPNQNQTKNLTGTTLAIR